jgi:hypothetical protein
MAGEVASLLLSRMTVPITYFMTHRRHVGSAAPVPAAHSPSTLNEGAMP